MNKYIFAAFAALAIGGSQSAMAKMIEGEPDVMYMPEKVVLNEEGEGVVYVHLNTTEDEYNTMEMNIYLPEGFTITKNARGNYIFNFNTPEVVYDHTMASRDHEGYVRIVGTSLTNSFLLPGDNWIFNFTIKAPEGFDGQAKGHIQDIMYASGVTVETVKQHYMEPCYFTVESHDFATGVDVIGTEDGEEAIYNLQGMRVERPLAPGIYIINGQKVAVK